MIIMIGRRGPGPFLAGGNVVIRVKVGYPVRSPVVNGFRLSGEESHGKALDCWPAIPECSDVRYCIGYLDIEDGDG